jgi:hypothetical protein
MQALNSKHILFIGLILWTLNSQAELTNPCSKKGDKLSTIDTDLKSVDGANTGLFFRETFKPLTKDFSDSQSAPYLDGDYIELKRVTAIATRATAEDPNPGANGGMSKSRLMRLNKGGVTWEANWHHAYLLGYDGSTHIISDANYFYSKDAKMCSKTSVWPSAAIQTEAKTDSLKVKILASGELK